MPKDLACCKSKLKQNKEEKRKKNFNKYNKRDKFGCGSVPV